MIDFPIKYKGIKAVLYARVSSVEQAKGFSTDAQKKLLIEYAQHPDRNIEVDTTYYIDEETAKIAGRTKFNQMLQYLRAHPDVKHILVEKTDRLYRNFSDYVLLEDLDLVIHLVKENEILSKESRSHTKFIHGIKVLMAKNYIDNLSEEVIKGMDQKASQGEWPSRVPLGYMRNIESHKVDIDEKTAPHVRRLFEEYATGRYSLRQLVVFAKQAGLVSKNSNSLNKAAIHRILINIFYTGKYIYKNKLFENAVHEPLVSDEIFNEVQLLLRRPKGSRVTKRSFAYRGLVKCHRCGCSMTPDMKMGKYVYYRCTEYKGRCKNSISEAQLADKLTEVVRRINVPNEVADGLRMALHESHEDKIEFLEDSIKSLV